MLGRCCFRFFHSFACFIVCETRFDAKLSGGGAGRLMLSGRRVLPRQTALARRDKGRLIFPICAPKEMEKTRR
jgi:hypothetical protein